MVLRSSGYEVEEARDGDEAIEHQRTAAADLILLDLRMPGLNGLETLYQLRAGGDETPVVILAAHIGVADVIAAMRLGVVDFLLKPVTPLNLRSVVSKVIE